MSKLVFIGFLVLNCVLVQAAPPKGSISERIRKREAPEACNCACGGSNRQMRVVGGNKTKVHEFPWIAGLSKGGEFHCGATLITRRHLLTAAHCVNGFLAKDLTVVLADHDRSPSTDRLSKIIVRGLKSVKEHQRFDVYSFNNDIAILELDEPVEFGASVQPVCLPSSTIEERVGKIAVVAGWGKVLENAPTSPVLRKVAVPIWSQEKCWTSGYGKRKIMKNMFCAGYEEGGRDACQGDSGGPLHMSTENDGMELIGVVSWGRGCARPNLPGVYTNVNSYLDWVKEAIGDECLCKPKGDNKK